MFLDIRAFLNIPIGLGWKSCKMGFVGPSSFYFLRTYPNPVQILAFELQEGKKRPRRPFFDSHRIWDWWSSVDTGPYINGWPNLQILYAFQPIHVEIIKQAFRGVDVLCLAWWLPLTNILLNTLRRSVNDGFNFLTCIIMVLYLPFTVRCLSVHERLGLSPSKHSNALNDLSILMEMNTQYN